MKKIAIIIGVSLVALGLFGALGVLGTAGTSVHAAATGTSAHALAPKIACNGQIAVSTQDAQGNTTSTTCMVLGNTKYFNSFAKVCNYYSNTSNVAAEIDMGGNQEFVSPGSCYTNTTGAGGATIQVVPNN